MKTCIQIEQLLQEIRFAIQEARKVCPSAMPVIRMAPDTHDEIWAHLQKRSTGWGDIETGPDSFKTYSGCVIEVECSWVWGVAIAVEELQS